MNINQHPPDPARVAIVQDITQCSEQAATQAVSSLDEYDAGQSPPETSNSTGESSGGYASLPDLLPVGKSALIAAGYGEQEAANILQTLFNGLAATHGGKRLYLPKLDNLQRSFARADCA